MTETLTQSNTSDVSMTDSAARRICELMAEDENAGLMLRVSVSGGGCSGFQYGFTFDDQKNDDDHVIARGGASVVIDDVSWGFLAGSQIDFVEELVGRYFAINNPNAASTCGCGTSFSI